MKFLATGTNGFGGKRLCAELLRQGHAVCAAVGPGAPGNFAQLLKVLGNRS